VARKDHREVLAEAERDRQQAVEAKAVRSLADEKEREVTS
jgi:hypothetical protein